MGNVFVHLLLVAERNSVPFPVNILLLKGYISGLRMIIDVGLVVHAHNYCRQYRHLFSVAYRFIQQIKRGVIFISHVASSGLNWL